MSQASRGKQTDMIRTIEADLATTACHAAIELDNLIDARQTKVTAISRLVEVIKEARSTSDEMEAQALLNPSDAFLVGRAMTKSWAPEPIQKISDLVVAVGEMESQFTRLLKNTESFRDKNLDELVKMKSFAMELSKYASAAKRASISRRPQHPYRR